MMKRLDNSMAQRQQLSQVNSHTPKTHAEYIHHTDMRVCISVRVCAAYVIERMFLNVIMCWLQVFTENCENVSSSRIGPQYSNYILTELRTRDNPYL